MRNYSANLYRKFKTRTLRTLNGDEFYDYFMRVVESGARIYGQKNEILIKTVDEKWVNAIDSCMGPLQTIIRKPRKFIKSEESIVPIELAKKVGSEAVKHLATHTQFISRVAKDGSVIPNKVLNLYTEDNFDIYENRFIMTLLYRIDNFINRRYDALFKTTGEEFQSVLKIDSSFNDNDEKVEYELKMRVHQGQTYLESDSCDRETFERIDNMKKMLASFKKSEFFENMVGCNQVRNPIQKTNLITKEPNFKACYKLWQFLDGYDEPGFAIERATKDVEFTEDYVDELNSLALFTYLVMKNNLDDKNNKAIDIKNYKKKRKIKPKFVSSVIEEFIYDYDIPELELRNLFNVEISKAYKNKYNDEEDIRKALESALGAVDEEKQKEEQENSILAALEQALGNADMKKSSEEDRIAEALKNALKGSDDDDNDKEDGDDEESGILEALQKALGDEMEKKRKLEEEESIKNAIEVALGLKRDRADDEE